MRYQIDHDFHLHSVLSVCANDREQIPILMLEDAKKKGLKTICITDHYWDDRVECNTEVNWWYEKQNHDHVCQSLPLPQDKDLRFLFGCEADMDSDNRIGLSPSRYDAFDFIVVATTHFHHMTWGKGNNYSNEEVAHRWVERFDAVLDSSLPFQKVGIAHLACELINRKSHEDYLQSLSLIPEKEMERLFASAARKGMGIELNYGCLSCAEQDRTTVFRIFETAKRAGCKFYLGTDAHTRKDASDSFEVFQKAIDWLGLEESDKFILK